MNIRKIMVLTSLAAMVAHAHMTPPHILQAQQQQHLHNQMMGAIMTQEANERRAAAAQAEAMRRAQDPCVQTPALCATSAKHNRYGAVAVRVLPNADIIWHAEENDMLFFFNGETVYGSPYDKQREQAVNGALQKCEATPVPSGECMTLFTFTNMSFAVVAGTMRGDKAVRFYFSFPTAEELARQQGQSNFAAGQSFLQTWQAAAERAYARCQQDPEVVHCERWEERDATVGDYLPGFENAPGLEPQFR